MKKKLIRTHNWINTEYVTGLHPDVFGDFKDLIGHVEGLHGNVTGLKGNATYVNGNIEDCEITEEERIKGIDIEDLIK